jgi:hypothetical protein
MQLIVVEDGLASNAPHVRELQALGMSFILGVKPSDHAFLYEHVETAYARDQNILLMMPAFLLDQVQELTCPLFRAVLTKTGSKRVLWERIRSHFWHFCFTSMRQLHEVILHDRAKEIPLPMPDSSQSFVFGLRRGHPPRTAPQMTPVCESSDVRGARAGATTWSTRVIDLTIGSNAALLTFAISPRLTVPIIKAQETNARFFLTHTPSGNCCTSVHPKLAGPTLPDPVVDATIPQPPQGGSNVAIAAECCVSVCL